MSPIAGTAVTWGKLRKPWPDAICGSRHFPSFPVPSHPLARWTRDGVIRPTSPVPPLLFRTPPISVSATLSANDRGPVSPGTEAQAGDGLDEHDLTAFTERSAATGDVSVETTDRVERLGNTSTECRQGRSCLPSTRWTRTQNPSRTQTQRTAEVKSRFHPTQARTVPFYPASCQTQGDRVFRLLVSLFQSARTQPRPFLARPGGDDEAPSCP